jgi:hypothetical protein
MKTEELARELYLEGGFGHEDKYNSTPQHYRDGWEFVAKYVQRLLIDRAIEELEAILSDYSKGIDENAPRFDTDQWVMHRIDELRKERESF